MKATKTVMALCDEMFERKSKFGANWPWNWKQKTREKMQREGLIDSKGRNPAYGEEYYFTDIGLVWYLELRPERNR